MPTGDYAAQLVAEAKRAEGLHGGLVDAHHAFGVLKEEVDELWDAIKADNLSHARLEAVQVGAMALRFLRESELWERRAPRYSKGGSSATSG